VDIFNQPTVAHFAPQRYTALNSTVAKALQLRSPIAIYVLLFQGRHWLTSCELLAGQVG
jgi:hypothetical protein